jgi:hypothetical protein
MDNKDYGEASALSTKNKAPRVRSVAYPSYGILACVSLTGRIAKEFTDLVFTPREDISKHLNLSGGALLMQLSSCVQYGLLTMKSKEGYKPTDLYKKINRPLPEENTNDFLKECLQKPELYKKLLVDLKDKELPTQAGLANILDRKYSVKGNAAALATKIFFKNLEDLYMISNNSFSFDLEIEPTELLDEDDNSNRMFENTNQGTNQPQTKEQPPLYLLNPPQSHIKQDENLRYIEIPIPLKDGRKAKLLMPERYTDEDIAKVYKVVNGYLP